MIVYSATEVSVGDVVAYPGRLTGNKTRSDSDWLSVARVDGGFVRGKRVHQQEWEKEIVFAVYPVQIADNGVEIRS